MVPKVLALNPRLKIEKGLLDGLIPTSWDAECYWMSEDFAFSRVFNSTTSPFLLMEARRAFVLSLLDPNQRTYFSGMSELTSLLFYLRTTSAFYSTTSIDLVAREYTSKFQKLMKEKDYTQMVLWEENLDMHLEFLAPHARLILASTTSRAIKPSGFDCHQTWSYESDSEIGKLYLMELTR